MKGNLVERECCLFGTRYLQLLPFMMSADWMVEVINEGEKKESMEFKMVALAVKNPPANAGDMRH